ncbi:cation transporter, partial [Streptomyces sp. SID7982]|nr:cation transporter [Streptomyces sp. SID7982]
VPIARVIYLEPDIYNAEAAATGTNPGKTLDGPAETPSDSGH